LGGGRALRESLPRAMPALAVATRHRAAGRVRRRTRGCLLAAPLAAAACAVAALLAATPSSSTAFFGPAPHAGAAGAGAGLAAEGSEPQGSERRQLLSAGLAAATGVAAWAQAPGAAEAFRADRILNAKKKYVPKIRLFYQKLEGLRDDIYLDVEFKADGSRVRYAARPADWYDGLDSKMDGPVALHTDENFGCDPYPTRVTGMVVLVPRGRCPFAQKVEMAMAAGAKSVIVWDEKMSNEPLEVQGKVGAVRSKGIASRSAGDALSGGVYLVPRERGVTIMAPETGVQNPAIDAVMITLRNGTDMVNSIRDGNKVTVLDVKRFDFSENINQFCKKELKKMLNEMEIYSTSQRLDKDDFSDPIIKILANDRAAFEKAVRAKDYAMIRSSFKQWNNHLDPLGKWELTEVF